MLTAMATAFHADGTVDLDGTAAIAAHLIETGNDDIGNLTIQTLREINA